MQGKLNIYLILAFLSLLMTWLFVGVSYHDEFFEPTLFTKYKPTFKVKFNSPIGMSDLTFENLSPDRQLEENAFQEFVKNQGIQSHRSIILEILPVILIHFTLTFLCLGIYTARHNFSIKTWQIPVHFLLHFVITSLGVAFILHFYQIFTGGLITLMVIAINYLSLSFLVKGKIYL
jgi:hypothetical protein